MSGEEVNYTHENDNWRQRLEKEQQACKQFDQNYDYLCWKGEPTHLQRPSASVKVKYYKPNSSNWSVRDKRIPLHHRTADDKLSEAEVERLLHDPDTAKNASHTCALTHTLKLKEIAQTNTAFKTTSSLYGSRKPIEMFGVAEYGIKATRSKEPVGDGTKIYYK